MYKKNVDFEIRLCGIYTIKDGKQYKIQTKDLYKTKLAIDIREKI